MTQPVVAIPLPRALSLVALAAIWACSSQLHGCGRAPVNTPASLRSSTSSKLNPAITPPVQPAGLAPQAQQEGAQLLELMRLQNMTGQSFEADVSTYSEGYYSGAKRTSELRRTSSQMHMIWARPAKMRVEITQTSNPIAEGAVLTTLDTRTCRVKARGILGLIPLTLQADDSKLADNRNYTLRDTSPKLFLDRVTAPGAVWTVLGAGTVEGVPVRLVQVDQVKRLDAEVTREVLAVDPSQRALRQANLYAGNSRVAAYTMKRFRWNPPLAADTFVN